MLGFSAYSQDTIPHKKSPVLSVGIRSLYAIMPYTYSFGVSTFNLKNNFLISYNNFYNVVQEKRPGIQFGYNRYFFKKTGLFFGVSYNHIFGNFGYTTGEKYNGSIFFKNLEYLTIDCSFYHRFKFRNFGVIEPSLALTYFWGIKSNDRDFFYDLTMPRFLINFDIKYYFKRNKSKK